MKDESAEEEDNDSKVRHIHAKLSMTLHNSCCHIFQVASPVKTGGSKVSPQVDPAFQRSSGSKVRP